ncbi:hypothetical protein [Kribbella sp. NPDC004875]|uniref:hypothetical protein n=1 Tax=Kribbella sp. NPDC004875 TaxID=3364107 RepID=UPI0036C5C00C
MPESEDIVPVAFNEAFAEISTIDDFRSFADQAGNALLDRATTSAEQPNGNER